MLPLVPGFGYVTGAALDLRTLTGRVEPVVLGTLLFVLGFGGLRPEAMFVTTLGRVFPEHRVPLMRIGGVAVIAMALVFLGAGSQRTVAPVATANGLAGAPALGAVFGPGGRPAPPDARRVIALATATDPSLPRAVAWRGLLPSAGVALPRDRDRLGSCGTLQRLSAPPLLLIHRLGGALLLVVGVLLLTGLVGWLTTWLRIHTVLGFEVIL